MREQQRHESSEPCDDRIAARLEAEGVHCAWCDKLIMHEDGYAPDEAGGDLICEDCNDANERRVARALDDLGITRCPDCDEPTHASESDDTGRCASCRPPIARTPRVISCGGGLDSFANNDTAN